MLKSEFDSQGYHGLCLYLLPSLYVWGNAAVKPLPAVNNGVLYVKALHVSVCAHTCATAVGSMYVFKPVAMTRLPAAPSAQSVKATFGFMHQLLLYISTILQGSCFMLLHL